ncbi:MAG: hypothetical protein K2I16_03620 [Muribaculaceae bacterium]|nr:hypothetical protein [Muribaculaceae bacterium]
MLNPLPGGVIEVRVRFPSAKGENAASRFRMVSPSFKSEENPKPSSTHDVKQV